MSGSLSSRNSTRIVAKVGDVWRLARKALATICERHRKLWLRRKRASLRVANRFGRDLQTIVPAARSCCRCDRPRKWSWQRRSRGRWADASWWRRWRSARGLPSLPSSSSWDCWTAEQSSDHSLTRLSETKNNGLLFDVFEREKVVCHTIVTSSLFHHGYSDGTIDPSNVHLVS